MIITREGFLLKNGPIAVLPPGFLLTGEVDDMSSNENLDNYTLQSLRKDQKSQNCSRNIDKNWPWDFFCLGGGG